MSAIPQHEATTRPRKGKKASHTQPQPQERLHVLTGPPDPDAPLHTRRPIKHDIEIDRVAGLSGIEQSLDSLASAVHRITNDGISLSTGYGSDPVKITLANNDNDDTMDRLVTAFERIADSVARLAGLTRPRLESWHEQEEYTPRFKDTACDGGAPGPKG